MDKLTDDILTDIISRVPYKSTCCCKCVATRWRDLFSHRDHRKKLPQSLAGFFYEGYNRDRFPKIARYFTNVSGEGEPLVDPSLSFLPGYNSLDILDSCNGLLLCRRWHFTNPQLMDYVVCNPATEKWVVVPATDWSSKVEVARLGFEPAVSSHFHVFEFIDQQAWCIDESEFHGCVGRIEAVATYSSNTGVWRHQVVENNQFAIPTHSKGVFFNSIMHLAAFDDMVVTFDVQGNLLWTIGTPPSPPNCDDSPINDVFVSQGQLHFANNSGSESGRYNLSVWVLEDYDSKWSLKHTVSHWQLFGTNYLPLDHNVIAFHPECNMIFIVYGHENTLMSYEMDCRKRHFLRQLGRDCKSEYFSTDVKTPFIPYVPLFTESLADGS
ncbi:F-box protein At5g07610 isoform X1 [Lolium perenne]|uniref:F-box protein At5g07610 isoform X1 n=1 Tax=Lolium perenne TaxID=4522 RepID=UPI0021EA882E|nr:uncharacterized protein LOC127294610 [Lolium perenne]